MKPYIHYLEVELPDKNTISAGEPQSQNVIQYQFPLTYLYKGRDVPLGILRVVARVEEVRKHLLRTFFHVLPAAAVKIFLISSLIFFLFHRMVGRHLKTMADYTRSLDIKRLDIPLHLKRAAGVHEEQDELSQLVFAMNAMRKNLAHDIAVRKQAEDSLRIYKYIVSATTELPGDTVFYEDKENDILIGLVRHSEEVDYFGYFKKMSLMLHNITMLKRNRLPVHGESVYIKLKEGQRANVVIIGDSGAGKSETLEALRSLADEHICEMRIIFEDMGSIGVDKRKRVAGYGTEIGASVRLDDLEPGYAYVEIDRAIFMNPDRTNARLTIPITPYHHIVEGYPIDMVLYANNYEKIDEEHSAIEFFSKPEEAFAVFRSGARLAKGTTDEKGLVHTYFANPFGAIQRKEAHEKCAFEYFRKIFDSGIRVGQIRTRLGIDGFEQKGPKEAALELFKTI